MWAADKQAPNSDRAGTARRSPCEETLVNGTVYIDTIVIFSFQTLDEGHPSSHSVKNVNKYALIGAFLANFARQILQAFRIVFNSQE